MIVLLALAPLTHAQDVLPVHRVRFYETGVAYFERSGTVGAHTRLPVPRSHLDDALKTLVVLGGDTEVGAIRFPSSTSDRAARVLAGFGEGGEQLPFEASLRAMQGFEVEVDTGGRTRTGLLMDVSGPIARPQTTEGDPTALLAPEFTLTQLLADGSVVRSTTTEVDAIRPKGEQLTRRLEQAVLSTGTGRARQERALTVDLWESGPLTLGYLAETPVWRVSYRAVLDGSDAAHLQAWALVHNDTDEDWSSVRVELANGQPDSFLYPLATPRYAERALVTPEVDLAPVPQLATDTPDGMWDAGMSVGASGYGYGGGGSFGAKGYGGVSSVRGEAVVLGEAPARLKEAEPVQTPTQFIYKVARPLDLPAQHSALVPLIQAEIAAEAVVAFAPGDAARNGVWVTNDTARTLPSGVLSVFEAGGLAGESALNRLKPEEHQMVLFGNELDVELARETEQGESALRELRYRDRLIHTVEALPRTERFTLTNRSGRSRDVWVALPITVEEELDAARQELDPQRNWTWIPLEAAAGESKHQAEVVRGREKEHTPQYVAADTWRQWAEQVPDEAEPLLEAAALADSLAELRQEHTDVVADIQARESELTRLREDLRAAGDAGGTSALTRRVASVEQEIRKLQAQAARALERIAEQEGRFDATLAPLAPVEVSAR